MDLSEMSLSEIAELPEFKEARRVFFEEMQKRYERGEDIHVYNWNDWREHARDFRGDR